MWHLHGDLISQFPALGRIQMYDLGRKKLLRKCENKQMPSLVVSLTVSGDRVFAGDQMESCHCFKYRRAENQLVEFADDQVRPVVSLPPQSAVPNCFSVSSHIIKYVHSSVSAHGMSPCSVEKISVPSIPQLHHS